MTDPSCTSVALAVFTRISGLRVWTLVTDPGWHPAVTDTVDDDLRTHQFTDPDFDIAATIMVFRGDGTGPIREGYLIPIPGRCPLCGDRRSITVRRYYGDTTAAGADLIQHTLIHWGEDAAANVGIIDRIKPCPACCLADYLFTADRPITEPEVGPR
jgi:hypothetical protein